MGRHATEANVATTAVYDEQVEFSATQVSSVPIVIPYLALPSLVRGLFVSWGSLPDLQPHLSPHCQSSPKGLQFLTEDI